LSFADIHGDGLLLRRRESGASKSPEKALNGKELRLARAHRSRHVVCTLARVLR